MELIWEILWHVLRTVIVLVVLVIVIYFLIPVFFGLVASPDATYKYSKENFKKKPPELSEQKNHPELVINTKTGEYSMVFGVDRRLIKGMTRIHAHKKWHSSSPKVGESPLVLKEYVESKGNDDLGGFHQYTFVWELANESIFRTSIKQYPNQPFLIFEQEFPEEIASTSLGNHDKSITSFPCFQNDSPNTKIFTFKSGIFAPPEKKLKHTSAPVMFYDDELNSFIMSSMNNFLVGMISKTKIKENSKVGERINCGISGEVESIPRDFIFRFIMYFGKGINDTFKQWGNLVLKYYKRQPHSAYADPILSCIGYWTDNGAHYYYKKEKGMTYQETYEKLLEYAKQEKIPFGYYQFDSWFYYKAFWWMHAYINMVLLNGGIKRYEFKEHEFPDGIQALQKKLGKPIACHSRWFHARSKYAKQFKFYKVGRFLNPWALPLEYEFWEMLMKQAKSWGLAMYEQDWMNNQFKKFKYLRNDVEHARKWLLDMGNAATRHRITIQYCMTTPAMLLQSVELPNVTNARTGGDYNARFPKKSYVCHNTQTSILTHALGIWPSIDTFRTNKKPGHFYVERQPELMTLMGNLSAGIVGPGDPIGYINRELLMKTCRDDGLLLKPDRPLTPVDYMFKKHSTYYICSTVTEKDGLTWHYILVVNVHPKRVKDKSFTLEQLGIENKHVLFDYSMRKIQEPAIDAKIYQNLKKYEHKYYVLAPMIDDKIAIIGNPEKFVTCSNTQFKSIRASENEIIVEIEDLPDATLWILAFPKEKPVNISTTSELKECGTKNELESMEEGWIYDSSLLNMKVITNSEGKQTLRIIL